MRSPGNLELGAAAPRAGMGEERQFIGVSPRGLRDTEQALELFQGCFSFLGGAVTTLRWPPRAVSLYECSELIHRCVQVDHGHRPGQRQGTPLPLSPSLLSRVLQ